MAHAGEVITSIMDNVLIWLLYLPRDAALVLIALGTSLVLTLLRKRTADQKLLARISEDKRTLRKLAGQARADGDKAAARRHRENIGYITWHTLGRTLKGEGLTLFASLPPLVLIGTWCFYRLEYHAPRAGEPLEVSLLTPAADINSIVHLVPQSGVQCQTSWVQQVAAESDASTADGIARWTLVFDQRQEPYELTFRVRQKTLAHPLLINPPRYLHPQHQHDVYATSVRLREVRLLNVVPGIPQLGLPPWTVAYLILAVGGVFILKRIMHVY